jgi:hypothetical protein
MKAFFLGFVAVSGFAFAQGTFSPAATMTTARSQHTATLLTDGRVLLAGGAVGDRVLSSAEIYDPSTGIFSPTGDMTMPRVLHTATLLADGRVLIFGGNSAELYNPSTGTFIATGNLTAPHGCNAAPLKNGQVLIVDDPPPFGGSATAVLYDPDSGTFAPTGAYASIEMAELDHTLFPSYGGFDCPRAIALADGRVLVAGGTFAELYDPDTGTFSITGTKITLSNGFAETVPQKWSDPAKATLLLNGTVLFDGGDGIQGPADGTWVYDPSSGTFTAAVNMATPRESDTTTLLPDGSVLVAGSFEVGGFGDSPPPRADASVEIFDPSGTFTPAQNMTTARYCHTATLLNSGKVLIAGGISGHYPGYQNLSSAELYTPPLLTPAPILFAISSDVVQGAIWHADTGQIASSQNPAAAGDVLATYTTSLFAGGVIPPQVAVGGKLAEILFFGAAPGYPGYNQVNFRVPNGVASGPAVPVRLNYLGRSSNEVAIGVR